MIQYLAEGKEESDNRLMRAERLLSDRDKEYNNIMVEYRKMEKMSDSELGQTRLDLRMKCDEVSRVTHLYEDNLLLVKELKMENEAMKQKMDVLKTEYYSMESKC